MSLIHEKYINPFTDFGFKRLFGEEAHKDLLIDFLNSLLEGEHVIESLEYKKLEQLGKTKADRRAIFDLYCTTQKQEHIIIELQRVQQDFFKDRSIYYSTFPIQSQGKRGEWNYELMPVYTIGILNFVIEDKDKDKAIVKDVKLVDRKTNQVFYEKLHYIYLQLPNFNKTEEQLETKFDKWLYTLKNLHKIQNRPNVLQGHIFERLFKIAEVAKLTQRQLEAYEQSTKEHLDWINCLNTAVRKSLQEGHEKGLQKGIKEGLQKGLQEGLHKGLQEGRQKGIEEGLQKGLYRSILKLLHKNQSIETISELMEVDLSIVEKLKQLLDKYADTAEDHLSEIL